MTKKDDQAGRILTPERDKMNTTSIIINPTNVGHVIACFGLIKMAEVWTSVDSGIRRHPNPTRPLSLVLLPLPSTRFEPISHARSRFVIETIYDLHWPTILTDLSSAGVVADESAPTTKKSLYPCILKLKGRELCLNWWLDDFQQKQESHCVSITPGATMFGKFSALLKEARKVNVSSLEYAFDYSVLSTPNLCFDARSRATTWEKGYKSELVGEKPSTFPFVELLAAIGMQYFRPFVFMTSQQFSLKPETPTIRYFLWAERLEFESSQLAAFMPWSGLDGQMYLSTISSEGSTRLYFNDGKPALGRLAAVQE